MAEFKDFQFKRGDYQKASEYFDDDALILAIRNILLSKPGNFPFNPSIGMNIKKYQFEFLDDQTISDIQSELDRQIALYIPTLGNVSVYVGKIEDENERPYLTISVGANMNGEDVTSNFILSQDGNTVNVFNETN